MLELIPFAKPLKTEAFSEKVGWIAVDFFNGTTICHDWTGAIKLNRTVNLLEMSEHDALRHRWTGNDSIQEGLKIASIYYGIGSDVFEFKVGSYLEETPPEFGPGHRGSRYKRRLNFIHKFRLHHNTKPVKGEAKMAEQYFRNRPENYLDLSVRLIGLVNLETGQLTVCGHNNAYLTDRGPSYFFQPGEVLGYTIKGHRGIKI